MTFGSTLSEMSGGNWKPNLGKQTYTLRERLRINIYHLGNLELVDFLVKSQKIDCLLGRDTHTHTCTHMHAHTRTRTMCTHTCTHPRPHIENQNKAILDLESEALGLRTGLASH